MIKLRIGTFNLFQFVEPPYSWYEVENSFSLKQWDEKTSWIKQQIKKMDCDIIGFQEVFSSNSLKKLTKELGFDYFVTVDKPIQDAQNPTLFITTTVALASKYPILELQEVLPDEKSIAAHNFEADFEFSRTPIKAIIQLPNALKIAVYVNHLKSNRLNEFEYVFNKNHSLKEKINRTKKALENNHAKALKQRVCEASSLFFDFKKTPLPIISLCDLNDKEFSLSIEALTNEAYHACDKKNSYLLYDAYYLYDKKIYNPHPEQKKHKRVPTSSFLGVKSVLDYIFVSKEFDEKNANSIGKISSYEVFNSHLQDNSKSYLLQSDHAQVVCEIELN